MCFVSRKFSVKVNVIVIVNTERFSSSSQNSPLKLISGPRDIPRALPFPLCPVSLREKRGGFVNPETRREVAATMLVCRLR